MDIYPVFCYKVDNIDDNCENVTDCSKAGESDFKCSTDDSSSLDHLFSNKRDQLSDSITIDDIKPDVFLNSPLQGSTSSHQPELYHDDNLQPTFQSDENKAEQFSHLSSGDAKLDYVVKDEEDFYAAETKVNSNQMESDSHLSGDTKLYCIVKDEEDFFPAETEFSVKQTEPDEGNASSDDGMEPKQSSSEVKDLITSNCEIIRNVAESEDNSSESQNKKLPAMFKSSFKKIGCLYRCLSLGMFKDESKHGYIRSHITSNIINHWDYYSSVLLEYKQLYNVDIKNAEEYKQFMLSGKSTGSCLELSVATCIFNIFIDLINSETSMIERYGTSAIGKRKIFLLFTAKSNSSPSFDYIFESPFVYSNVCSNVYNRDQLKSRFDGHPLFDFSKLKGRTDDKSNIGTDPSRSSNNNKHKNNYILQKLPINKSKNVTEKPLFKKNCNFRNKNDTVYVFKSLQKMQMDDQVKSTNGILKIIPKSLNNTGNTMRKVILANINGKTIGIVGNLSSSKLNVNSSKGK